MGMLINVMSAIDVLSVPDPWAQSFCPMPEKADAIQAASQALKPTSASVDAGREPGGSRMNQPLTVPLFLPRRVSEHSQVNEWRTVPSAPARRPVASARTGPRPPPGSPRRHRAVRRRRPGPPTPAAVGGRRRTADGGVRPAARPARSRAVWAVVITGMALFMASLDNLVVSTALPVIRVHLHAGLSGLEWTVNAYTLTFAVLLMSAAAMGERFGRRRIFVARHRPVHRGLGRRPPWPRASGC